MAYEKLIQLLHKVGEQTKTGKLPWEETYENETYQVSFPKYSIKIYKCPSREESETVDIYLSIYNEQGSLIESINDVDIRTEFSRQYPLENGGKSYSYMKMIYDLARRRALGVDKAIDEIIDLLDTDDQ